MNNTECKIQMLDLYFSRCFFEQERGKDSDEYQTTFNINYAVNNEDDSKIKVTIDTSIINQTGNIKLEIQTVGIFRIDNKDMEEKMYEHLVKVNTVAIIFPYIRSQVSLLTTQPGIKPVMLPPMNLNALIDSKED